MKIYLILIVLLLINQFGKAQLSPKLDFAFGYGFYEGYYIGSEYYFKNDIHSISLSIGFDKSLSKYEESYSLMAGYDFAIFKSYKNSLDKYKWTVSNRAVLWKLEDDYYIWKAISLLPSLRRKIVISKKINMSIDVGPAFIIVLSNKRKTYEEVGWPYNYFANFRFSFLFL